MAAEKETVKKEIETAVDQAREDLIQLSHSIHDNPELGFQEHKAVEFISSFLGKYGIQTESGYCGIPTALKAERKIGTGGPVIAFLAEYDALPGIGHGCGHNVIAACGAGAFLGLLKVMEQNQIAGEVKLIGTPAEEGGAGKAILLERGGFEGVEFALMMHPTGGGEKYNYINRGGRASSSLEVSFTGKAAHSSVPALGINALNAVISVFNQIDMLRPVFEVQDNVNGVILEGGVAANIIPELARAEFCVRAETKKRLLELVELIKGCIRRAESLTGAKASIKERPVYAERYPCLPVCMAFQGNMERLGIKMCLPEPGKLFGSSDIGNVSIKIPAIHDYLSITDDESIRAHSAQYAAAAVLPQADEICVKGAKGLAMTGLDLLLDERLREEAKAYHQSVVPDYYKAGC